MWSRPMARSSGVWSSTSNSSDTTESVAGVEAGEEPTPLRETGRRLGMSAERVRQVEETALERLAENGELASLREAA